jgi:hypothetical protein
MSAIFIDLTGKRFGRLLVLFRVGLDNPIYWACKCDCGNSTVVGGQALRESKTRSCGCFNKERAAELKTTHGLSRLLMYNSWKAMMVRCTDPTNKDFPEYGGRGITVQEEWYDVTAFYADMGDRPKGTTLERKDNNGPYCAINCKWATPMEQGGNKRNNHEVDGVHLAEAARKAGMKESTLRNRFNAGMSAEQALQTPVRPKKPSAGLV